MASSIFSEVNDPCLSLAELHAQLHILRKLLTVWLDHPEYARSFYSLLNSWHLGFLDREAFLEVLEEFAKPLSPFKQIEILVQRARLIVLSDKEASLLLELRHQDNLDFFLAYLNVAQKELIPAAERMENLQKYFLFDAHTKDLSYRLQNTNILNELHDWFPENSSHLSLRRQLFIKELNKKLKTTVGNLEHLKDLFYLLAPLHLLENILNKSALALKNMNCDKLCDGFDEELVRFHHVLGKLLFSLCRDPLSDVMQAICIGDFRKALQDINDAYRTLKESLSKSSVDTHLCCLCHSGEDASLYWPSTERVFHLPKLSFSEKKPVDHPSSSLLIFTCGGGEGHMSLTRAIAQYTAGEHHILAASMLEKTLATNDILKKLGFNFSQEQLYNYLLKNEKLKLLKIVSSIGAWVLGMIPSIKHSIRLEILKQNPSMLISCMVTFNAMILSIAEELDLPLIIVPTDLNTTEFIKGMSRLTCNVSYPDYRLMLAYENTSMRKIAESRVPKERIHVAGFPLRPEFIHPPSLPQVTEIRSYYDIQSDEKVILVMMGGNAGFSIEKYAQILAAIREEDLLEATHILCLCGNQGILENQKMLRRINLLIPKHPRMRIQAVAATPCIAELMVLADTIITKPGGCTTNEALALNVPVIFHAPFALMTWEKFNMKFYIGLKMGYRFSLQSASAQGLSPEEAIYNRERLLPLLLSSLRKKQELKNSPPVLEQKNFKHELLATIDCLLKH